jgi:predicted lipoprotein with Yx(FWY)xxD motif
MRRSTYTGLLGTALLAVLALAACGQGASGSPGGSGGSSATTVIHVHSMTVGGKSVSALTNVQGLTLYYLTKDTTSSATCSGSCAKTWPPLLLPSGSPGSDTSLSGTLTFLDSANGRQVVYNGYPLYTYSGDSKPGDANGNGYGGIWFVATSDLAFNTNGSGGGY